MKSEPLTREEVEKVGFVLGPGDRPRVLALFDLLTQAVVHHERYAAKKERLLSESNARIAELREMLECTIAGETPRRPLAAAYERELRHEETTVKLAAAQAEARVLREALKATPCMRFGKGCGCSGGTPDPCARCVALATPSDDSALRELLRRFGRDLVQKLFGFESTESLDIVDKQLDAVLRGERG